MSAACPRRTAERGDARARRIVQRAQHGKVLREAFGARLARARARWPSVGCARRRRAGGAGPPAAAARARSVTRASPARAWAAGACEAEHSVAKCAASEAIAHQCARSERTRGRGRRHRLRAEGCSELEVEFLSRPGGLKRVPVQLRAASERGNGSSHKVACSNGSTTSTTAARPLYTTRPVLHHRSAHGRTLAPRPARVERPAPPPAHPRRRLDLHRLDPPPRHPTSRPARTRSPAAAAAAHRRASTGPAQRRREVRLLPLGPAHRTGTAAEPSPLAPLAARPAACAS